MAKSRNASWVAAGALLGGWFAVRMLRSSIDRQTSFHGKSVVITGGSRGLGLALARELVEEGARVGLIARDVDELHRAIVDLRDHGGEAYAMHADLKVPSEVERVMAELGEVLGPIDMLINNAGEILVSPLEHLGESDFEQAMAIHFWAPLHTMLAVLPGMVERSSGRIINISSFGGRIPVPHLAAYCASKFALTGLSQAFSVELRKRGIWVTTVCPGLMRTGSHLNAWFKGRQSDEFTWFSLAAAAPGASIQAERAARKILDASRARQSYLAMPFQIRMLELAFQLMPNAAARFLSVLDRFLPHPGGSPGEKALSGWHSQSHWTPSPLTRSIDQAAVDLNELGDHSAIALLNAALERLSRRRGGPDSMGGAGEN